VLPLELLDAVADSVVVPHDVVTALELGPDELTDSSALERTGALRAAARAEVVPLLSASATSVVDLSDASDEVSRSPESEN